MDVGAVKALIPVVEAMSVNSNLLPVVVSHPLSCHLYEAVGIAHESVESSEWEVTPKRTVEKWIGQASPVVIVVGASRPRGSLTLEQHAVNVAKEHSIPTVCIVDYWGNYGDRFNPVHNGHLIQVIPDTICALDSESQAEMEKIGIPPDRISVTYNPCFDRLSNYESHVLDHSEADSQGVRLLFVSQPLKQNEESLLGYDQEVIFTSLSKILCKSIHLFPIEIHVWVHPLEEGDFWSRVVRESSSNLQITISNERGPDAFRSFDLVVSGFSTMIYEAIHCDVPCLSLQIGLREQDQLITNKLGLSTAIYTEDSLAYFFADLDISRERQKLSEKRRQVSSQDLFFSDGCAVDRILSIINHHINGA